MNKKREDKLQAFVAAEEGRTDFESTVAPNPQYSLQNEIGWVKLKLEDLPTKGLFYLDGTEIAIKAATGNEIRHWSTLNEEDINGMDDMLNYILERCCTVRIPNYPKCNWKDIVEIDRFYIILSIRELTFKSENPLQVKISETKTRPVTKDMITFANFDEKLMNFYNHETKTFHFVNEKHNLDCHLLLPTLGITAWIKNYVITAHQKNKPVDMDFLNFAPFIIGDWRDLTNVAVYESLVEDSKGWSISKTSLISQVKDMLTKVVNPEIMYLDEHGMEVRVPVDFLGGIKSLFIISNIFDELL